MPGTKALYHRNSFVRLLDRFLNGVGYPICVAMLCAWSGLGGSERYPICMSILAFTVALTVLFSSDYKPVLAPMLMAVCALGRDRQAQPWELTDGGVLYTDNMHTIAFVLCLAVVMGMSLLIRFWMDGVFQDCWKNRGVLTYGILAMDGIFLLNGVFSSRWTPMNMLYGLFLAFGFTFFYFLAVVIVRRGKNVARFACQCMLCAALLLLAQTAAILLQAYRADHLVFQLFMLADESRRYLAFGWWVPTTLCAYIALGIPAAFYLAANHRCSGLSYLLAFLMFGGIVVLGSRGALLVGGGAVLAGGILCCLGKNKKACRIYGLLALTAAAAGTVACHLYYKPIGEILQQFWEASRMAIIGEDLRLELWDTGLKDFLSAPVFGVGLQSADVQMMGYVFGNMYHCVLVQFPASMGLVGAAAFGLHIWQLGKLFHKPNSKGFLLLLLPVMILTMSLADNFFFYINQQIAYCVFLALTEQALNREDNL